jgi:hypothetical protein
MNSLRKLSRLLEGLLHVFPHLFEECLGSCRVGLGQPDRELEVDRKRDQVLLHAVVQLAFDPAPVGVGREDEPSFQPRHRASPLR